MKSITRSFAFLALTVTSVFAAVPPDKEPPSWNSTLSTKNASVADLTLPAIDRSALLAADDAEFHAAHDSGVSRTKRIRVAQGSEMNADSLHHGTWETLDDGSRLWRLRIQSPGATEVQIGFRRFDLPAGASVYIHNPAERIALGPYAANDRNQHGGFWAPMLPGDMAIVEMHLPAASASHRLEIGYVGSGYRDLFGKHGGFVPLGSGSCNINIACPLGDEYQDEIRSVAHYSFVDGSTYICTGTLINNRLQDGTPYFLTAAHCVDSEAVAGTMTFYWNYESTNCQTDTGWSLSQNQSGAQLRMTRANVDTTLVQLNSMPDAEFNVFYSGWDATGTMPDGSIGIHHPAGDVKKITEDANGISTMNNCIGAGTNTHWRTGEPYTQGTTEGGSSGSGLWIPAGDSSGGDRLLIGVLSGGTAACAGQVPDNGYDCYGKFSAAWDGNAAASRLRDWLDPQATGELRQPGMNGEPSDTIFEHDFECSIQAPGCDGEAGIVVVSPLNIPIPDDFDGLSIHWLTGDTAPGEIAGYHFNPYRSGTPGAEFLSFWWNMGNANAAGVSEGGEYLVLQSGDTVGPDSTFDTAPQAGPTLQWRQPGGVNGYLGFRFTNTQTGETNYGYVQLSTTGSEGFPATILGYAYNALGYPIGIP